MKRELKFLTMSRGAKCQSKILATKLLVQNIVRIKKNWTVITKGSFDFGF